MPIIDRRTALLGLSGLTCTAIIQPNAVAGARMEDWQARLRYDLAATLRSETGTHLTLLRFAIADNAGAMSAVVEMTWRPGRRRRRFEAEGATASASYEALRDQIIAAFAADNPTGFHAVFF